MTEIICASTRVKETLINLVNESGVSQEEKQELNKTIQGIATCIDTPISLSEEVEVEGRKKRTPSAFNLYIKDCMGGADIKAFKEAPQAMKKCTLEWNRNKEALKEKYEKKKEELYGRK